MTCRHGALVHESNVEKGYMELHFNKQKLQKIADADTVQLALAQDCAASAQDNVEVLGGSKRQPEFDVAKGIGILSVIVGHGSANPVPLRTFIYSFHMPLFFIISGFFMKPTQTLTWDFVKKQMKSLLLPYAISCVLVIVGAFLYWVLQGDSEMAIQSATAYLKGSLLGMGEGSVDAPLIPIISVFYYEIGAVWFLWGLFWAKLLLAALNKVRGKLFWLLAIWCCSIASTYWYYLPLSIQAGCCAALFLYIGQLIREKGILQRGALALPTWIMLAVFALANWLYGDTIYSVAAVYGTPILNILGSTAATLVIIKAAQLIIHRFPRVLAPLDYIGQMTLALLCMHLLVRDIPYFPGMTYYPSIYQFATEMGWNYFLCETVYNLVMPFILVGILWLLPQKFRTIFLPKKLYKAT